MNFDHHCPALGNCIGLHNYKFFLLVIIYSWLAVTLAGYTLYRIGHLGTIVGYVLPIFQSFKSMGE